MNGPRQTRRAALGALGAGLVSGLAPWSEPPAASGAQTVEFGIVDAHVHVVQSRLPGSRASPTSIPLAPFDEALDPGGPARLSNLLSQQFGGAGIEQVLCMPRLEVSDEDPLGIKDVLALAELVQKPELHPIGVIHPERFDRSHLAHVEATLEKGRVKALKAYLGYFPYMPHSAPFRPYYKLAAKYDIPVILHTGDTWSRLAKVKYAHPLEIDEVAVDFPDTRFVLAHFGNPWVMDAAEVVYKNENVWAELSAFLVGDTEEFRRLEREGIMAREVDRIKRGIEYTEAYDKFLFGTDWPLAPVADYCDFVRKLIPAQHHDAVFRDNARKLFKLA